MEKVTIHRALAELKLIGAKIDKQINELEPSGIVQKDKLVNGMYQREAFESTAKERFQAVTDLIDRRSKIKSAIVEANAITRVTIAGVHMTIGDAITLKSTIASQKLLVEVLKRKHTLAKSNLEQNNTKVDNNALDIAKVTLGKQGVKLGDDDVQKAVNPYLEANKFALVDPLEVDKRVIEMAKKIGDFEAEVDATLSEINAITLIEI